MIARKLILALASIAMTASLWAQQSYVERTNGTKVAGRSVTADANGNLSVQMDSGVSMTIRRQDVKLVVTPMPPAIANIEKMAAEGKDDDVIKAVPALLGSYRFLGWNGMLCHLEGLAQMRKGDLDAAEKALQRGLQSPDRSLLDLQISQALLLAKQKKSAEALKALNQLAINVPAEKAPFLFNTRGAILATDGKDREAVLEYLKTLLVFKPGEFPEQRAEAKREAIALLKKLGDPRATDLENVE